MLLHELPCQVRLITVSWALDPVTLSACCECVMFPARPGLQACWHCGLFCSTLALLV